MRACHYAKGIFFVVTHPRGCLFTSVKQVVYFIEVTR